MVIMLLWRAVPRRTSQTRELSFRHPPEPERHRDTGSASHAAALCDPRSLAPQYRTHEGRRISPRRLRPWCTCVLASVSPFVVPAFRANSLRAAKPITTNSVNATTAAKMIVTTAIWKMDHVAMHGQATSLIRKPLLRAPATKIKKAALPKRGAAFFLHLFPRSNAPRERACPSATCGKSGTIFRTLAGFLKECRVSLREKRVVRSSGATSNTKGSHRFCETIAACEISRTCRVSLREKRVVPHR